MIISDEMKRLKKINRLMVIVFWVTTLLQTLFTAFVIEETTSLNWMIVGFIMLLAVIITVLNRMDKHVSTIQYVMTLFLPIISFVFTYSFHDLNGLITVYLAIVLVALYQDYRFVLITALLCAGSLFYGYQTGGEKMFGSFYDTSGLINIYFTLGLLTYFVSMNARSSKQLIDESLAEKKEKEVTNEQINSALSIVKESVESLMVIESSLNEEISSSSNLASKINDNFSEIDAYSTEQNSALNQMQKDIATQVEGIDEAVNANGFVESFTKKTNEMSENASDRLSLLSKEMASVETSSENAVSLIKDFLENVNKVTSVLESVKQISEQINLLSLNASIEAARAGEHGRGFAVVAEEVGKLAIESKASNVEIEEILNGIVNQSQALYEDIEAINDRIVNSNQETKDVMDMFKDLKSGALGAEEHAVSASSQVTKAQKYSLSFSEHVHSVLSLSDESTKAVNSSLDAVQKQNEAMVKIVEKSESLKAVINRMKEIL